MIFARSAVCLLISALAAGLSGCANLIGSMAADTLSASILNQSDPELVASGVPAYLLLVDGFIFQSPENEDLLAAGATIYALYGTRFTTEADASIRMTSKARRYGQRAMCLAHEPACSWSGLSYDAFAAELAGVRDGQIDYLYAYALGWLSYLEATSEDL